MMSYLHLTTPKQNLSCLPKLAALALAPYPIISCTEPLDTESPPALTHLSVYLLSLGPGGWEPEDNSGFNSQGGEKA